MALSGAASLEEHLLCSICLEMFSEPVCTPCEHTFCKECLYKHWNKSTTCVCPLCKSSFSPRPYLKVNTLIAEIVDQVKKEVQKDTSKSEVPSEASKSEVPSEASKCEVPCEASKAAVPCDVCSDPKLPALKSCLVCLSSFCESHLQPHLSVSGLKRHQLLEPVEKLEDRMCSTHQRPLELFCSTDDQLVCMMCSVLEHKNHHFLPLKDALEKQKVTLGKTASQSRLQVKQRQQKLVQVQTALEHSERSAAHAAADLLQVFSSIVAEAQACVDRFSDSISQTQHVHRDRGNQLISELQQEICTLEKSSVQANALTRSDDALHVLQGCSALHLQVKNLKQWDDVKFEAALFDGCTARALSALEAALRPTRRRALEAELKRVQVCAVEVTFDPETAHPKLLVSKDKKKVHHSDGKKKSSDAAARFSESAALLGSPAFSTGRRYYEVQVEGKSRWEVGVAEISADRKRKLTLSPGAGFWVLRLCEGEELVCEGEELVCPSRLPVRRLGVYVDAVEGVVSFHDPDSAHLLCAFSRCSFRGAVAPFFSPGTRDGHNSAPLVITTAPGKDTPPCDKATPSRPRSKAP